MTKNDALLYLRASGFSANQINEIVDALTKADASPDAYYWDYYARVEFLRNDGSTREVEYHMTFPEHFSYADAMRWVITTAEKDIEEAGEMISAIQMV